MNIKNYKSSISKYSIFSSLLSFNSKNNIYKSQTPFKIESLSIFRNGVGNFKEERD